jgi:hypothetical protein
MTRRKTLESALARAEAALQRAVTLLAADGADRGAAGDSLDKARANCRLAHAALADFDNAER